MIKIIIIFLNNNHLTCIQVRDRILQYYHQTAAADQRDSHVTIRRPHPWVFHPIRIRNLLFADREKFSKGNTRRIKEGVERRRELFTCSSVILGTELIARPLATETTKLTTSNKKNIFETAGRKWFQERNSQNDVWDRATEFIRVLSHFIISKASILATNLNFVFPTVHSSKFCPCISLLVVILNWPSSPKPVQNWNFVEREAQELFLRHPLVEGESRGMGG